MTCCKHMIAFIVSLSIAMISLPTFSDELPLIKISDRMPYAKGIKVPEKVRTECELESKLAKHVKSYLEKNRFKVSVIHGDGIKHSGQFLDVRMIGVHGDDFGSWESGGGSMVVIKAEFNQNGKTIDTFSFYRKSNRRFQGICGLLENCVKTLGKDISGWLVRINPPPPGDETSSKEETSFEEDLSD